VSEQVATDARNARLSIYTHLLRMKYMDPDDFLTLFDEDQFQGRMDEAAEVLRLASEWISIVQEAFSRERQIVAAGKPGGT
jgi:hypothetical protein